MRWHRFLPSVGLVLVAAAATTPGQPIRSSPLGLTPEEQLGKHLFFDTALSTPFGQACAACHSPEVGFTGGSPQSMS